MQFDFKYKSILESEERMYQDVRGVLENSGLPDRLSRKVILAISEGFTNALIHGNKFDPEKEIEILLLINNEVVIADIIDEGVGQPDSLRARQPSLPTQEGGRGIDIMESLADAFDAIRARTGGLRISMRFERRRDEGKKEISAYSEEKVEINRRDQENVVIISLSGRLDLSNGGKLKDEVKKVLASGKTSVHLNLKEVEFVNSSGLGALVSIMKEIRLQRGRLTLSDLADYVQEIFDITQLSHIFEIFTTEEEALNSYQVVGTS
jgi:anti-sigma B factor antagonist